MDIDARIKALMTRPVVLEKRKAALAGQLEAKRAALGVVEQAIRAAGFDPKTLVEDSRKAREALEAEIVSFEADLVKVEAALDMFDRK